MSDTLTPQIPQEATIAEQPTGSMSNPQELGLISLKGFLGSDGDDGKLEFIFQYFNERAGSIPEMLLAIRQIENKLGMAAFGNRTHRIYEYLKISSDIEKLSSVKQSLENAI